MRKHIRNFIKNIILECIKEQEELHIASAEEFLDALLNLNTLNLEDSQVGYPNVQNKNESYLLGGNNYDLYILNRNELPESGPFEIFIKNDDNDIIGFIRGTKSNKTISFNLIHIQEEYRGSGIGTDIYEKFLNDGYVIKSDKEITDDTYSMYDRLLRYGYKPIVYKDGRVGLVK